MMLVMHHGVLMARSVPSETRDHVVQAGLSAAAQLPPASVGLPPAQLKQAADRNRITGEAQMKQQAAQSLIEQFMKTWNAKDIPAFGQLFEEDADFVDVAGHYVKGRKEIEHLHVFPLTTMLKHAVLSQESLTLRDLGQNLISGDFRWKNVGSTNMVGGQLPDQFGNIFFIMKLDGEQAHFVSARNTNYTGGLGRGPSQ